MSSFQCKYSIKLKLVLLENLWRSCNKLNIANVSYQLTWTSSTSTSNVTWAKHTMYLAFLVIEIIYSASMEKQIRSHLPRVLRLTRKRPSDASPCSAVHFLWRYLSLGPELSLSVGDWLHTQLLQVVAINVNGICSSKLLRDYKPVAFIT